MAAISMQNGCFSFGERTVFDGVDLDILKGEVLCILGANGCGKTTLLRCLNGTLRLKTGAVCLDGTEITEMDIVSIARRVGFVFQEHSAPFPFSVLEVVRMGRAPHLSFFGSPSRKDTEIAEKVLDMVGMLEYRNKPYTQISGGERQLVLIARTLAQEPDIILMDEPTSHLDFKNQALILRIVNRLAKTGMGVIMTSHFPDHALLYSDKVALMADGGFVALGTPDDTIIEPNLKQVYGIDVKVLRIEDSDYGRPVRICLPSSI
ncbi:MAG: ABC transporter ATP-binding protein [Dehalococcoidales bacterium]|jgi:iron complex transport system ATP-binding protein|nr:ABC transporter ATP-binding protein [Dehalococcoidales bacterium]